MRRLLRLPVDAPRATEASARQLVETSLLISMARCLLTYVVLPFVLPVLGIAAGVTPFVGIVVGIVAIAANVASVRRFWRADHRYRWHYTALATVIVAGARLADRRRSGRAPRVARPATRAPRRAPSVECGSVHASSDEPSPSPRAGCSPFTRAVMRSVEIGGALGGLRLGQPSVLDGLVEVGRGLGHEGVDHGLHVDVVGGGHLGERRAVARARCAARRR